MSLQLSSPQINVTSTNSRVPMLMHKAARGGRIDWILQFIRSTAAHGRSIDFLDTQNADGLTPLHIAIMHGHVECVEGLLSIGCSPSIACNGVPVIHLALVYKSITHKTEKLSQILEHLIKGGASLTEKDEEGQTAFHLMAKYGISVPLIEGCTSLEKILRRIRNVDTTFSIRNLLLAHQDCVGNTPFHVAAKYGNAEVLRQFIKNCSEIECASIIRSVNEEGNTAMHVAAMNGHPEVAAILLRLDPTCNAILNIHGKKPIDLAKDNGHDVFVDHLCKLLKYGGSQWPNGEGLLVEWKRSCLPTWIITSQDFWRHKTAADGCKLRSLPPENNRRWSVLVDSDDGVLHTKEFEDLQWHPTPKKAEAKDVLKVHDFTYYEKIQRICASLPTNNADVYHLDGDTAISHDTFHCALLAAGCVCEAIDIVMKKQGRNAFCVVRPPGHHAGYRGKLACPNEPIGSHGFCIFNNVAIGGAYALDVYRHAGKDHETAAMLLMLNASLGIRKVAILDFDVHHGNGTEQCVMNTVPHKDTERLVVDDDNAVVRIKRVWHPWLGEDDQRNIMFASVQGYGQQDLGPGCNAWFYPGSGRSRDNFVIDQTDLFEDAEQACVPMKPEMDFDQGETYPRIINIGISGPGNKTDFWKRCWRDKILPSVVKFDPDLILLSSGFDAHRRDSINGGFVGLETYHYGWLTRKITEVANKCCSGRIVSVLEGGYAVQGGAASAFAASVAAHVAELNSKNFKEWDAAEEEARNSLNRKCQIQRSLALQIEARLDVEVDGRETNSDAIALEEEKRKATNDSQQENRYSKRRRQTVDYVELDRKLREETVS